MSCGGRTPRRLTEPPGYVLRASPESLDAYRFEQLVSAADGARARGAPAESSTLLVEALGLWRGGALADVADLGSAQPEIARLEPAAELAPTDPVVPPPAGRRRWLRLRRHSRS